ncbi:molybdate ABC transporter substrate-binding protein [Pasteurellaceae bacterium 22721_9_1]
MKKTTSFFTALLTFGVALSSQAAELHLYAGAGLKKPVEKIVKQFEQQTGNKVIVEYAGSGQLLARYNSVKSGDLFLPGSDDYVKKLAETGNVTKSAPLVLHIPVMAIRKDKANGIDSFKALADSQLRLGIGDSKAMALGKGAEKILALSGYQQQLEQKIVVRAATVQQLMLYLLNGDVDAAVVGRAGAWREREKLSILPSPAGTPEEKVAIALLNSSKNPTEAEKLLNLFASPQGIKYFTDEGFLPLQ